MIHKQKGALIFPNTSWVKQQFLMIVDNVMYFVWKMKAFQQSYPTHFPAGHFRLNIQSLSVFNFISQIFLKFLVHLSVSLTAYMAFFGNGRVSFVLDVWDVEWSSNHKGPLVLIIHTKPESLRMRINPAWVCGAAGSEPSWCQGDCG